MKQLIKIGMKMSEKLNPCPFCGSESMGEVTFNKEQFVAIYCEHCGSQGMLRQNVTEAKVAWNQRIDNKCNCNTLSSDEEKCCDSIA